MHIFGSFPGLWVLTSGEAQRPACVSAALRVIGRHTQFETPSSHSAPPSRSLGRLSRAGRGTLRGPVTDLRQGVCSAPASSSHPVSVLSPCQSWDCTDWVKSEGTEAGRSGSRTQLCCVDSCMQKVPMNSSLGLPPSGRPGATQGGGTQASCAACGLPCEHPRAVDQKRWAGDPRVEQPGPASEDSAGWGWLVVGG